MILQIMHSAFLIMVLSILYYISVIADFKQQQKNNKNSLFLLKKTFTPRKGKIPLFL